MADYVMPVIEQGTYDDFKACVFRVLSLWAFDVMMSDLGRDLEKVGLTLAHSGQRRSWRYQQRTSDDDCYDRCVTEVEIRMIAGGNFQGTLGLIAELLDRLGSYYGFRYERLQMDHREQRQHRFGYNDRYTAFTSAPPEVSCTLVFPNWQ